MEHKDGLLINFNIYKCYKEYIKISFTDVSFSIYHYNVSDCYRSLKDDRKVVQIHNIIKTTAGEVYFIGKHFIEYSSLYS